MKRLLTSGAALALALTVGPLVPGAPAPEAAASGKVLVKQTATMTGANRITGTVPPPDRRIERASVNIDVTGRPGTYTYFIGADVTLTEPPNTNDLLLILGFGHRSNGTCSIDTWVGDTRTYTANDEYFIDGGYNPKSFARPSRPWDCVSVALTSSTANPVVVHDQVAANLKNTFHSPKLAVGQVRFLGKKVKQLRLVRGTKNFVEVTVRNRGKASARNVRLTGTGKGVQVGKARTATLVDGRATTFRIPIRINAAKPRKVRLTVRGGGVRASRVIVVRPTKAPPRPVAGRYRSPDGRVTFRVRNGRVANVRVTTMTRCGVAPSPYTYTQNTYDFPTRKVPRNGILDAVARGKAAGETYGTALRLRIAGSRVTHGVFTYGGPGACSAIEGFTARRVGP